MQKTKPNQCEPHIKSMKTIWQIIIFCGFYNFGLYDINIIINNWTPGYCTCCGGKLVYFHHHFLFEHFSHQLFECDPLVDCFETKSTITHFNWIICKINCWKLVANKNDNTAEISTIKPLFFRFVRSTKETTKTSKMKRKRMSYGKNKCKFSSMWMFNGISTEILFDNQKVQLRNGILCDFAACFFFPWNQSNEWNHSKPQSMINKTKL